MAMLRWVLARRPRSHAPSGLSLLASVGIAALAPWMKSIRNYLLPRLLMPSGDQPEPGAEIAGPSEGAAIADRGDEGGGVENPAPWDRGQPAGRRIGAGELDELRIQDCDPSVEILPFSPHVDDELAHAGAHGEGWIVDKGVQGLFELAPPLWEDVTALQEKSAQLVEERLSSRHEAGANPVQRLDIELLLALEFDKAHRRPRGRLGDSLRIPIIVLLRFDVGAHILG